MSETRDSETLMILRRLEPMLSGVQKDITDLKLSVTGVQEDIMALKFSVAAINTTLPHLATKTELEMAKGELKAAVLELKFDLTWRFLSLLGVILLAYLGAVWFVVVQTMKAHGVG